MKLLFLVLSFCIVVESQAEVSVDEIITKANLASFYAGEDGRAEARMMIVDNQGNKQLRQFVILRRDLEDNGEQNFLVVFSRPADVKDTVFLVHKKINQDDDRWLYLPALDLEKRISASDNRTSFVGSDFFYEDVSGRNPEADIHSLENQDEGYYYLESIPKDSKAVEFSRYTMKIDKQSFLPMLIEYHNEEGEIYRRVEVVAVEVVQGYPTVIKSKVSNLNTQGHTLLEFRRPSYDLGMDQSVFSLRSLRHPPRK